MLGKHTYEEIKSQGEAWSRSLKVANHQIEQISNVITKPWPEIVFTGCGSTFYLSLTAALRWQTMTGIRALGVPGSEAWLYPESIFSDEAPLLIAISRSGATTETLRAINTYKERYQLDPIVISCYPESEMMTQTRYPVLAAGGQEKSVAQTRSFTSMLLMTHYLMWTTIDAHQERPNPLLKLPDAFDKLVSRYECQMKAIAQDKSLQKFVFLGSGVNYGIACEAMLKMKEMSLSISEPYHFMEYRHGPKSMVAEDMLIVGLIHDATRQEEMRVLAEMKEYGATILAITESADGITADHIVEMNSGVDVMFRGPLYLPALQFLAYYRAIENGLDPDNPANLTTVVELND